MFIIYIKIERTLLIMTSTNKLMLAVTMLLSALVVPVVLADSPSDEALRILKQGILVGTSVVVSKSCNIHNQQSLFFP